MGLDLSATVSRRTLFRRTAGAGLALAVASPWLVSDAAEAGEDMCAGDPIIWVDGQLVQVSVSIPKSVLSYVTKSNPVRIRVNTPNNVSTKIVAYTGVITELVEFNPGKPTNSGLITDLDFSVFFPQQGGAGVYRTTFRASSLLQTQSQNGQSGVWQNSSLRVTRALNLPLKIVQASTVLCAPGIGVLGL